jgi:VIT1/CCC1 family predicted Fe2+/Mn2+ transporter
MKTKKNLNLLRTFWKSEIIADNLYNFLAKRYRNSDKREPIIKIGKMEGGHATIWNSIAHQDHNSSFRVSLILKFEILLMKLLSCILPFTIFIHYMEHIERNAILEYAKLLETYNDNESIKKMITNVIRQEIGHEWLMMEQLADKGSYIAKAKEAIDGMTGGIIQTLALVIGLLAVHATSSIIAVTGLIAMIGGMIAIMSVSYISSKAHLDFYEGRVKEISIKQEVHPMWLKQELETALIKKGMAAEMARDMMNIIGDDPSILFKLFKTIKIAEEAIVPQEIVKTTTSFFIIGTLPILIPFFIGGIENADPLIPAAIAFALALIIVSIAGLFIAVLSGKKISVRIIHKVSIILGASTTTYLIGLAARIFFGFEPGH